MRRVTVMPMLIAASVLAGCQSTQDLCRSDVELVCERQHECRSATEKATQQFILQFGTSVEDCKTRLYANPLAPMGRIGIACDDANTDQEVCINWDKPSATDVDFGKSNECRDARAALPCQDFINQFSTPSMAPAVCALRCRP
jgi:hypothetical protein